MAKALSDEVEDEELAAKCRDIAGDLHARWYEAYLAWRSSDGDHDAGRKLVKATSQYLRLPLTIREHLLLGDIKIMDFVASRFETVFSHHPELLVPTPKGGRNQPANVRKAILIAVGYLRLFQDDDTKLKKAKSLVADIYGTTIKTVGNWLELHPDIEPSDNHSPGLHEANLHHYAQEYRAWKRSGKNKLAQKKEN